jgi:hypothetical protein
MYFDLLLFQVIVPFSEDEKQAGTLRSTVNQTQDDMVNTRNGGNNEDNDIDEESRQIRLLLLSRSFLQESICSCH